MTVFFFPMDEFETYFQRKPIRPFPKSCNMSIEQTYGKIQFCSVLALNLGALHSDWFGLHTAGGWGRGRGKNRVIKRFRNRASSNHDFISINRTALICTNENNR